MPNHDRLLKQRNHVRSVASADVSQLHTSMQVVTDATRDDARKLLGRLHSCHTELSGLDQQVLASVDDSLYDVELDNVYKHRASLTDAIASLEGKLRDFAATLSNVQPSTSTDQLNERIPEMELTEFDGDPLNCEEFWDDFSTSVDQRTDITTITKFKLLRSCLIGKVAATCKGYRLMAANYDQVKSVLQERYGDKETAIALHLDALISLKSADSDAVCELVRIRDECELHIRALVILGFGDDAFGQLFAPIVLSKLPKLVRLDVRKLKKQSGDATWTTKRLRELLSNEIQLRASNECEFFGSCQPCDKACGSEESPSVKSRDTALFVNSKGQSAAGTRTTACAFCGGRHYSSDCDVYLDVASRHSRMGDRCFLCLRRGHWKKDCRANRKPCFYCRKRDHHCSLCLRKFGSPSQLQREAEQQQLASYEPHRFLPETICTANCRPSTNKNGVAILETAIATVIGKTGSCHARLVLDCGSTKSFMSAQPARRIGANLMGCDRNYIGRFGDATRASKELPRYEFSIVLRDGSSRNIHMNAEERLAPSVTLQPFGVDAIQPHCKPGDLAEVLVDSPTEAEVDILLGLDYYYSFVGQLLTGIGLILKESSLGIITTGYTQRATPNASVLSNRQSFFVSDNTVSRERSLPRGTSTSYSNLPPQHSKLQLPESWTSTLRALTSSPLRQTVVATILIV